MEKSTIHILLNGLLEKGAIKVEGFARTGKNYGRTYSSAVTSEEYFIMQFKQSAYYRKYKSSAITGFLSELIQDEDIDNEALEEILAILKTRKI